MRLLVIEDNHDILANLHGFLEPLGYVIDSAHTGATGLSLAIENRYDVIVLDLMLPGIDGLEVCRKLRTGLGLRTPVLMLTARDAIQDKVAGFESGADDYLVKPFSLVELDLRLKSLLRRAQGQHSGNKLSLGGLEFDTETFEARRNGQLLKLTPIGYRLLGALLRAAPRVLSREELERAVWGDDPPDSDALRTHIHALRQVIDKPFEHAMLKTMPGIGFRLVDPHAL